MVFQYLTYFFLRAIQNIRENRFLSFVTLAVITVSMFLFSCFLLIFHNLQSAVESWGRDVQVSVYLRDSVSENQARTILQEIAKMPGVAHVGYVSKEEAMQTFAQSLEGVSGILDDLGSNPLPASLEIQLQQDLKATVALESFVKKLERPEFEDIDWSQEWVEKFYVFLSLLRYSGVVLGGLLAAASIFIISQTIRLGFFARHDEFEILELVGATPTFIRIPFILEGFAQGLSGALLAEGFLYLAWRAISGIINTRLQSTLGALSFQFLPARDLAMLAGGGMILGLLASILSVRKVVRTSVGA